MATPEMHYFTRVTEHGAGTSRTAPAQRNGVPVRITAADGTFSLGMPSSVRTAAGAGYNVDLRLVPLTGCPRQDFLPWALKAGADWRLNAHPLGG